MPTFEMVVADTRGHSARVPCARRLFPGGADFSADFGSDHGLVDAGQLVIYADGEAVKTADMAGLLGRPMRFTLNPLVVTYTLRGGE